MIPHRMLFRNTRIPIKTPHFVTFYSGVDYDMGDEIVLKLSDSFEKKEECPELELTVRVLNVNKGHNEELMKQLEAKQ